MAGAMRFTLGCPRCNGTGKTGECLSGLQRRRPPAADGFRRSPNPAWSFDWYSHAPRRERQCRTGGAPSGDLYINIRVEDHPFFDRDGDNIEITVPVSVPEAALGAKIEVPTIDGRALLKIPMGTQNGQKFRLREKGVSNARKETRGDQIVQIAVQPPKANDERTRELLRELAELHPEDPRAICGPRYKGKFPWRSDPKRHT